MTYESAVGPVRSNRGRGVSWNGDSGRSKGITRWSLMASAAMTWLPVCPSPLSDRHG
jgi:hypothetical protein